MRLSQAICAAPVCQSSRASILTGQLCRTHGVHDSGVDLDPAVGGRGFSGVLSRGGYDTALFGKANFATYHTPERTGSPENILSSEDFGPQWTGPYMGFDHVELMLGGHNWFSVPKPPQGLHYEHFFHAGGRGEERQALYAAGPRTGASQCWHSQLPPELHNTAWTTQRAMEWLRQGRDPDKPFCAWVSFPDPHHPFDCPEPWSRLHVPSEVDLPPHRVRDFHRRPWWHQVAADAAPKGSDEDSEIQRSFLRLPEQRDPQLREIIANTYGQIAFVDDQVGKLMALLSELELEEDTYVFFLSDHGDWLGEHGLILTGPMFYDGLMRVPFLVRGPGIAPGLVNDAPISTMDLGSTLFDLADVEPMLPQHGDSLWPLLTKGRAARPYALAEWELPSNRVGVGLSLLSVRTRTARLTLELGSGVGEMYDLSRDPYEMRNLFDELTYLPLRLELEGYLAKRPNDMGPLGTQVGLV